MPLKPVGQQVVVVVGAGSGLGLAVAHAAAKAGAAVVVADRDEATARQAAADIQAAGGRAHPVGADAATDAGADRIGRAAAARFDRIDGWIDATGSAAGLAFAAKALARQLAVHGGRGGLVAFARRLPRAAATQVRRARGLIAPTLIVLPDAGACGDPPKAPVEAALYALVHPMGRMTMAPHGRRLTALTEAGKHRGVAMGVGLVALAGAAVWLNRGRIASAARPRVAGKLR